MKKINLDVAFILSNAREGAKGATLEKSEKQLKTVAKSARLLLKNLKKLNAPAMETFLDVNFPTLQKNLIALQNPDQTKLKDAVERHKNFINPTKLGEPAKLRDDIYELIARCYMLETGKYPDYTREFKAYINEVKKDIEWQVKHSEGGKKPRALSCKSALEHLRKKKNSEKIKEKVEELKKRASLRTQ